MTKQKKQRRKRKLGEDADAERKVWKEPKMESECVVMEEEGEQVVPIHSILPTRRIYSHQLGVLLKKKHLVLIEGDVGSGKSFLARHTASLLNLPLKVMQMGDQLDSKSLLGSYECTEVAGHFKWKKSNFNQWLSCPGVIVVEDVDTGNSDVITSLLTIASSRRMVLPTGEVMHLHPDCHLIATTQKSRLGVRRQGLLEGVHSRISLPYMSDDELKRLGKTIYPRIAHIVNAICKIFRELEALPCGGNSRKLTSSDVMRAFSRVNSVENLSSSQAILLELMDVWCICEPSRDRRAMMCLKMGALLSLTNDEVQSSLNVRTPSLSLTESSLSVGRVALERRAVLSIERSTRLGHTKGALQLLERMGVSVKMEEAVLLVGESGVGKTSLVQVLADMRGEKLATVNLGPHSDTDDLITSLRPTSYGRLLEPFTRDFVDLFSRSFDPSKNQKFLHNLEVFVMHHKYDEYLKVIEETAKRILSKKREGEWAEIVVRCRRLREGMEKGATPFALQRGIVREAADEGYWLLIDEINLAPPECLDAIVEAISTSHHPSFRLFACMNPATDTAKRRLPEGIRARFTEYFVAEDSDAADLTKIVTSYLPSSSVSAIQSIVTLYMKAKVLYPHKLSLRTLTRALIFAADGRFDKENRCLYEAFSMAFLSNMEKEDKDAMHGMIKSAFPCEKVTPMRRENELSMMIEGYEIERGESLPVEDKGYILTPTVKENLKEVARIVSSRKLAVLLEGETSAGKTSIVQHLAKITGNVVRRINNHEQTDVQEYLGSYVPDASGRLHFREGPLVEAVRKGHWVILDELNLAPSDVIETLNRLLDDNRELFISESNEVIKAHPRFRLFATQNPAGSYAGRKRLSRALLSRFVVLLFPILPLNELSQMVCARCQIAPSAADRMIRVLSQLRLQRSLSGLFSSKDGLMTLRDVFRWGHRLASDEGADWQAALIHHGFFLLAGRCRNEGDKNAVIATLESTLKGKIDEKGLFSIESPYFPHHLSFEHVILTSNMRRMLVLSYQALLRNEAVLVVGETGDGKTRLAQTIGGEHMMTINCHERTECSDLLGRLRPAGNGGFEWQDGVVISAMREGRVLLMDEISLAEDSVLERLNPLFEEKRAILLTESGAMAEEVRAEDAFKVIATMNPGGDYGKKELSKALRNRFTEIWSSSSFDRAELCSIFAMRINEKMEMSVIMKAANTIIEWINAFYQKFAHALRVSPSVRDVVACADMWSSLVNGGLGVERSLVETVSSVFIDGIPCQMTRSVTNIAQIQMEALSMIERMVTSPSSDSIGIVDELVSCEGRISMGDLSLPIGPLSPIKPRGFSLSAPTCMQNMYRVMRALYINKPILLEGSPGCGKSTLIMALASIAGYPITRLNLSEQTDLSDLFGSDVPIVDEEGKMSFEWKDGPILKAIKNGEWILLDEMNLASQSILEGLNACFDHRRVLYIAELAKEFEIPSSSPCRFFACQNPRGEGGSRRALPKSFVNRFTNIYTADLAEEDELAILREMDYGMEDEVLSRMVKMNGALSEERWTGGTFSFNLRDISRWMHLISKSCDMGSSFEMIYLQRLRVEKEKERAREIFKEIMGMESNTTASIVSLDEKTVRVGPLMMERRSACIPSSLHPLASQSSTLLSVMQCLSNGWISLLVGARNSGKRSISEMAASLIGVPIEVISLSSDTDASELIGSFEQKVDTEGLARLTRSLSLLLSPFVQSAHKLNELTEFEKIESQVELLLTEESIPAEVAHSVQTLLTNSLRSEMYFEWVDSSFVRAYTEGRCILIENVNLCNSAVLDRLNTSLEAGGSLVLSESRGDFLPIYPHKDFRVILSMDASEGEISRAMRNRSVEIFMGEKSGWNVKERDVQTILSSLSGKTDVSNELSCSLTGLPYRSILFSGLILSHYEEDSVAKLMNRFMSESMNEEKKSRGLIPRVNELMDGEKTSEWTLSGWKSEESGEEAEEEMERISLPLLPLMAASLNMLRSQAWKSHFGDRGAGVVDAISSLLLPLPPSNHPIDPTFHGDHSLSPLHKLSSHILVEWLNLLSREMATEEWSAISMSSSLSLYEMTSSPFYFNKMELSGKWMKASMDSFTRAVKEGRVDSEQVLGVCLSLLSLLTALSRRISIRSGDTRIRIAYSSLMLMIEKEAARMGVSEVEEWMVPSSVDDFLHYYNERRIIDAFSEKEQLENLVDIVRKLRGMEEETSSEETSFFSLVTRMGGRMERSLSLNASLHSMKCMNSLDNGWMRVMESIEWRDVESSRKSILSSLLSFDITPDVSLSSLLITSPVSLLLSSVWQQLGWDSDMSCITVRNLRDLSFDSFVSQLWRIGANSRKIDETLKRSVETVGDSSSCSSSHLLSYGVGVMERGVPPLSSLDPVIHREQYSEILHEQMRVVEGLIRSLSRWRAHMQGEAAYRGDESSSHPFLVSLYGAREKLREEMARMEGEKGQEKTVYREDSKQYSVMCREMHSLLKVCHSLIGLVGDEKWKEASDIHLMSSHVVSALKSAHTFLQDSLVRFGSLIDVMGGYWNGVWIVYLSLNMIHYEMTVHTRRLSLISTTSFPRHLEAPSLSWLGPIRWSMVEWAIRASSPLPLELQSSLVEWKISRREIGHIEIEWTRSQWEKWYEKNTKKENEKEFEYKEKTMEEKEEKEMEEMFSSLEGMEGVVAEETLIRLLEAFTEKRAEKNFDESKRGLVTAIAYLSSLSSQCGVSEKWRNAGLDASLYAFSCVDGWKGKAMDVYRDTSWSEVKAAIEESLSLKEKTILLREKWPEIQSLSLIVDAIEELFDSSLSIGQMRMAEKLEKIIEEAEEWEKLADRAHSLESVLSPLRERLVVWKKMEIVSWNGLVYRVKKECENRAALVAFPLFHALLKEETTAEGMVAMACDWISHSSFIDFSQRLRSTRCLAEWAGAVGKGVVAEQLVSVVAYFGQFSPKVNAELKEIVEPVERLMKDLVKIAQYKDLNILSIKASSKKNHIQLFKMVRRLKNQGGMEMSGMMDGTLDIEGWRRVEGEKEKEKMEETREKEEGLVKRAREISSEIIQKRGEILEYKTWMEMGETIEGVKKQCGTRIEYSGEEKEMESEQGRERNARQRAVALVIKHSQSLGVNSRRGMTLNAEEVSRRALTEIDPRETKRKNVIRAVALARSILIRRGMKPNEQLSTSTRGHLLGMVEYGCNWMMENEKTVDGWKRLESEMKRMHKALLNEMENREMEASPFDHVNVKEVVERMNGLWSQLNQSIECMRVRLSTVPSTTPEEATDSWSALSRLSSSSPDELEKVNKIVARLANLSERIASQLSLLSQNEECSIYSRSTMDSVCGVLSEGECEWPSLLSELSFWFEEESETVDEILTLLHSANKKLVSVCEGETFSLPTEPFLLFIQRLYKSTVERAEEWEESKDIDQLSKSAATINEARPQEMMSLLSDALMRVSSGDQLENLATVSQLFSVALTLLECCVSIHERCSHYTGVMIHRVAELGILLMEKGYLNTIPKEDKNQGGEGKEMEGEGEGGGMGEGKGTKDVTEEMEETGQIEGLQGDEEEEGEDEGKDGKNEKNERPIEMEEDFAKDIEDVDKDGEDGEEDEDGEGEEEPPMDDGMGDVDDKEEEEIDPHLWDEDEKEEREEEEKKMDDDNKGADEQTGEMAAREDKNAEQREDENKEDAKDEEEKEMEEKTEEGEEKDMENMDKNERENKEELDGNGDEEEKTIEEGEELAEEEEMEIGETAADENEEEREEKDGEEKEEEDDEMETEEDDEKAVEEEQTNAQMTEEEKGEEKEEKEENENKKMESGYGGEKNEEEKEEEGGGADREEEEEDETKDDEKGENGKDDKEMKKKKDGARNEKGKDDQTENEKKDEEDAEKEEKDGETEKTREIVIEDDTEMEEESEMVDGNEEEKGDERKESRDRLQNDRMMSGAGTMEEAKESMKRREDQKLDKKKERIDVRCGESGTEETQEEGTDTLINFNPIDLMALTEKLTNELVMGGKKEDEEVEMTDVKEGKMVEKSEEEMDKSRREWERMAPVVSLLAAELAENLRLILEPRLATRMEGDYRSGKRLNMKRIIPYIASQYRKNRIWMRRTKKAERNYQVLIAVDDSASMGENGMESLTCEGVCIVEEALRRVNAGELSVITFGESIHTLVPFSHASTTQSTGESLLSSLTFGQSSTDMSGMLGAAAALLEGVASARSEQMLIIISDGRGALANGVEKIRQQLARLSSVSVLFVIVDSGKKSIREMSVASFSDGGVQLVPYLSLFPFPLYVLAQSASHIPALLAEGIRQWIEYGANH